jgi:hypothetical protein
MKTKDPGFAPQPGQPLKKLCPLGEMLTPLFTPIENTLFSLKEQRGDQMVFTLGANFTPRG